MARIPTDLSGQEVRRALQRGGFVFRRQRGSHMVLAMSRPPAWLCPTIGRFVRASGWHLLASQASSWPFMVIPGAAGIRPVL